MRAIFSDRDQLLHEAVALVNASGAVMPGHYAFNHGAPNEYHSDLYVHARRMFRNSTIGWAILQALVDILGDLFVNSTQVLAGPSTCGSLLAFLMAGVMEANRDLKTSRLDVVFLDPTDDGGYGLRRFDRDIVKGKNILIVDGVRDTGFTIVACANELRRHGGSVSGSAVILDSTGVQKVIFSHNDSLPNVALKGFQRGNKYPRKPGTGPNILMSKFCPLCEAGEELTIIS